MRTPTLILLLSLLLAGPAAAGHDPLHLDPTPPVRPDCDLMEQPARECVRCGPATRPLCVIVIEIACIPNSATPRSLRPSDIVARCMAALEDEDESTPDVSEHVPHVWYASDPAWDGYVAPLLS